MNFEIEKRRLPKNMRPRIILQRIRKGKDVSPTYMDNMGNTPAMILAATIDSRTDEEQLKQTLSLIEKFKHDPNIQNAEGNTVAHILAHHGLEIPKIWYPNKNLTNYVGDTVGYRIWNQIVPEELFTNEYMRYSEDLETLAYVYTSSGQKMLEYMYHDKSITMKDGRIVYDRLLSFGPPEEAERWKFLGKWTLFCLAYRRNPLINQTYGDPLQVNEYGETVSWILQINEIPCPIQFRHDPREKIQGKHLIDWPYFVEPWMYFPSKRTIEKEYRILHQFWLKRVETEMLTHKLYRKIFKQKNRRNIKIVEELKTKQYNLKALDFKIKEQSKRKRKNEAKLEKAHFENIHLKQSRIILEESLNGLEESLKKNLFGW